MIFFIDTVRKTKKIYILRYSSRNYASGSTELYAKKHPEKLYEISVTLPTT